MTGGGAGVIVSGIATIVTGRSTSAIARGEVRETES